MLNRASAVVALCSVIALVVLLIVPSTRWIAWSLFRSEFDLLKPTTQSEKIERSALKHPNDIDSQIASALYSGVYAQYGKVNTVPKKDVSLELEKLLSNHSNSVALYANILRMMTSRRVKILREESYIFSQVPIKSIAARTAEDDANFEKYDRFAAEGEKLDPGNAYFPTMRSIGLPAAHKDKDSLEALHRASSCSHWNAYIVEPIRAGIRLAGEDGGRGLGMTSTYPLLVARNPNFAQLRELARVVAYLAEEQEKKSKFDSGIEIRLDVARLGSLLRFDETQLIGTLSGVAITTIAEMDPEGIRLSSVEMKLNSDEKHKIRLTRFKSYLEKHARKETQIWFAKENAKTIQLKKILETGLNRSPILTNLPVLTLLWVSGLLLLSNALVAICFGLLHHLSFKTSNFPIKETAFALFIALFYWQWSACAVWAGAFFSYTSMSDETPNHIPAFLYYSSFTYFCFISWGLAHLVILARTRKLRNPGKTPSSGSWFPFKNQEIEINERRALVLSGCEAKIDSSQTFFATASCFALLFTTVVAVASVVEVGYEKAVARTITHESRYLYELMGEPFPGMAE